MNNCQIVEVGTFRNIFSNPLITTNTTNKEENTKKTAFNKVLLAVKRTFSNKKKNKA